MIEWWNKSFELCVESGITKEDLKEIVQNSTVHLKKDCDWFFYTLERCNIPFLVFSAGLGDIIQEWIIQQLGSFKNMKIISNFMKFDNKTNQISGFNENIIHIFNKNEGAINDKEYEEFIENRCNLILLGDSVGDVDMSVGFNNLKSILKIGFLNEHEDDLLSKYMDIYDIVLIKDSTFEIPNAILRSVI